MVGKFIEPSNSVVLAVGSLDQALYVNGELKEVGDRIELRYALVILMKENALQNLTFQVKEFDEEWLSTIRKIPDKLEDVKFSTQN